MLRSSVFISAVLSRLLAYRSSLPARGLAMDTDVARTMSFGGSCANCNFAGRKLMNANFTGSRISPAR